MHHAICLFTSQLSLVPNYTAWWQRQYGVNNLPKVVTQQRRGRASNPRLLDRKSDALPLSHRYAELYVACSTLPWIIVILVVHSVWHKLAACCEWWMYQLTWLLCGSHHPVLDTSYTSAALRTAHHWWQKLTLTLLMISQNSSSSSRMHVMNYNWSATKQRLYLQS